MKERTLAKARWFSANQHSAILEGRTRKNAWAPATITEPEHLRRGVWFLAGPPPYQDVEELV